MSEKMKWRLAKTMTGAWALVSPAEGLTATPADYDAMVTSLPDGYWAPQYDDVDGDSPASRKAVRVARTDGMLISTSDVHRIRARLDDPRAFWAAYAQPQGYVTLARLDRQPVDFDVYRAMSDRVPDGFNTTLNSSAAELGFIMVYRDDSHPATPADAMKIAAAANRRLHPVPAQANTAEQNAEDEDAARRLFDRDGLGRRLDDAGQQIADLKARLDAFEADRRAADPRRKPEEAASRVFDAVLDALLDASMYEAMGVVREARKRFTP